MAVIDIYFDPAATGANDGSSWTDAYNNLEFLDDEYHTQSTANIYNVWLKEDSTWDLADVNWSNTVNSGYLRPIGNSSSGRVNICVENDGEATIGNTGAAKYFYIQTNTAVCGIKFTGNQYIRNTRPVVIDDCNFESSPSTYQIYVSGSMLIKDSIFNATNLGSGDYPLYLAQSNALATVRNCEFKNGNSIGKYIRINNNSGMYRIDACTFYDCPEDLIEFGTEPSIFEMTYSTVDAVRTGTNANLFSWTSAADDIPPVHFSIFSNIFYQPNKIIDFQAGGSPFSIGGSEVSHNCIYNASDSTNYTSGTGDITTDPLFTDAANNDYSLTESSPCIFAGKYGEDMGSYESNFSGGGGAVFPDEEDVLTGSGDYGPNGDDYTPSYSPDFPDAANVDPIDTTNGVTGTLDLPALNKVAPSDTLKGAAGTMDLPDIGNVRDNDTLEGVTGTYTPDFPEVENVDPSDTVDGVTGTLDLPALNKVAPSDTLKGVAGTMDLPALSSIDPADTLEGASGTMDLPELSSIDPADTLKGSPGTLDLPALNKVAPSDTLKGASGTMDLPEIANVAPDDTLEGVSGTMDLPALDRVSPNDTLRGATGTQDLPSLSNLASDDTLEGAAGTMDLPELSSVDPLDTLRGATGTMDVPEIANVRDNDTLRGVTGEFTGSGDYPPENKVQDGTVFDSGNKTGTLGAINESNYDISEQIKDNGLAICSSYLTNWQELDYLQDVSQNEKNNARKRYGVKIGELENSDELIGAEVLRRTYEVVLLDKYLNKGNKDKNQTEKAKELRDKMEELRRRFRKTNFGSYGNVSNTEDYSEFTVEFNETEQTAVCTMELTVVYRVTD